MTLLRVMDRVIFLAIIMVSSYGQAEPWLGTRMAQNCAGCHAPGRKNLPPKLRRCSLSCQGCHVNPNGGGLRSFYGKWVERYWLRSKRIDRLNQPKVPAPLHRQFYGRGKKAGLSAKNIRKIIRKGFPLVHSKKEVENESLYDRYHDRNHRMTAKSRREFEFSIPQTDPYRLMDVQKIDGGGDFRLAAIKKSAGPNTDTQFFLMEATFGIRYRPLRHTHVVYEARYAGPPVGQQLDTIAGSEQTRSVYVKKDDLPWNSFVMGGFYKPLFGRYSPDHTALARIMTAAISTGEPRPYATLYKAVTIGAAPNVPFGNIHYIMKRSGSSNQGKVSGLAGNIGVRLVTMGAQATYSFWSTNETTISNNKIQVEMHALELRAAYKKYILGLEAISYSRDEKLNSFSEGGIITFEGRYKLRKGHWATAELARSNLAADGQPGSGQQIRIGSRHFLFPGVEVATSYTKNSITRDATGLADASTQDDNTISVVLHTFF